MRHSPQGAPAPQVRRPGRTRLATRCAAALAVVALPLTLAARQVFRAATDMVILSVTVTDAHGHPIPDLAQNEFQVLEDGVPQTIELFTRDPQPISLSLLIDASTSMEDKLTIAREAAIGFTKHLGPKDVEQVIAFNDEIDIRQTFTNDIPTLERAIQNVHASGSTALYTAIYVALSELSGERAQLVQPGDIRRQAIVVLSDGEDTTSLLKYEDVLERSNRSDVAIYAIGLRDPKEAGRPPSGRSEFALRSLAQSTGGRLFTVDDVAALPQIYNQIADELATQYVMGYVSKNTRQDGGWRQIAVRTSRPEAAARTRTGYFAPTKGR
jgi:Ca-activated chloride channel family protein